MVITNCGNWNKFLRLGKQRMSRVIWNEFFTSVDKIKSAASTTLVEIISDRGYPKKSCIIPNICSLVEASQAVTLQEKSSGALKIIHPFGARDLTVSLSSAML